MQTDLKQACLAGKVQHHPRLRKKTEEKLLAALWKLAEVRTVAACLHVPVAVAIEEAIAEMPDVEKFSRAGSLRRMRETVKDLDFVISTRNPEAGKGQTLANKRY